MQLLSSPAKFPIPFGNNAGAAYIRTIPQASQIGVQDGAASLYDGFPPLNFVPISAGGVPPFGQDMNGILNEVTAAIRWQQAGGPTFFDTNFASLIGGYPQGTVLQSALVLGNFWLSTADNNATDPDSMSSTGWVPMPGMAKSGDLEIFLDSATPYGYVPSSPSVTVGNPSSGATYAAANTIFLYRSLWTRFPNTQCPVTGGRGANPDADFAAGKKIQTLDVFGSSVIAQDGLTGRLSGVPITSGSPNAYGGIIGENLHQLSVAEIASHIHGVVGITSGQSNGHQHPYVYAIVVNAAGTFSTGGGQFNYANQNTAANTSGENVDHSHSINLSSQQAGGNGSHNTVQRSIVGNPFLKL